MHCNAILNQMYLDADSGAWWTVTKTAHVRGDSSNTGGQEQSQDKKNKCKTYITLLKSQSDVGRKKIIIYDKMSDYYYYYYYYYYAWICCFHLLYSCKYQLTSEIFRVFGNRVLEEYLHLRERVGERERGEGREREIVRHRLYQNSDVIYE